jgi:hypothetical protein
VTAHWAQMAQTARQSTRAQVGAVDASKAVPNGCNASAILRPTESASGSSKQRLPLPRVESPLGSVGLHSSSRSRTELVTLGSPKQTDTLGVSMDL